MNFTKIPSFSELSAAFPGLRGLFFDMDGSLFDTEGLHTKAFQQIGRDFNIRPPFGPETVHGMLMGKADHLVFEIVKDWEGFPKEWTARDFVAAKNERFFKLLRSGTDLGFLPQMSRTLIDEAREHGLFTALITSSEKIVTIELLKIAGVDKSFDLILTRDDCPKHKPDPWPYVEAMRVAKLDPKEVFIFEDSSVGLEAARVSGAHVGKVEWFQSHL
jgi:HAD superfamily hydrolase (TIGR01509 family)